MHGPLKALACMCALGVLAGPAVLRGATLALEIAPSLSEVSECRGEEVAVEFRIRNPESREIAGFQAFLRYPAEVFEPLRYDKGALEGFTVANGPAPFGAGYSGCILPVSDPWDDGKGMDTVSVVSSAYGEGGPDEPLSLSEATLGSFVFRLLPLAAVPVDPVVFRLEFDSCSPFLQGGNSLFDGSVDPLAVSYPAPLASVEVRRGIRVRSLSCSADSDGTGASLSWDRPLVEFDGVNVYRDGEQIRAMVPAFQPSIVDDDAPAALLVYEVAVVVGGEEDPCRASCTLDLSDQARLFIRSDANSDGRINIADAIAILDFVYRSHHLRCLDAADVDDSGTIENTDVVRFIEFLFRDGDRPEPPYPDPAVDPTSDELSCTGV